MSPRRALILHPESDCYFEAFGEREIRDALIDDLCCEVTGIPEHEDMFQRLSGK